MSDTPELQNDDEYRAAVVEAEGLLASPVGTPEAERFMVLVLAIEAYENKTQPIGPPSDAAAKQYEAEKQTGTPPPAPRSLPVPLLEAALQSFLLNGCAAFDVSPFGVVTLPDHPKTALGVALPSGGVALYIDTPGGQVGGTADLTPSFPPPPIPRRPVVLYGAPPSLPVMGDTPPLPPPMCEEEPLPFPPYKADECAFLLLIHRNCNMNRPGYALVRDVLNELHEAGRMHYKRGLYVLDKFVGWGLYDYGVSLDLGWLTPEGSAQAERFAPILDPDGQYAE